MEFLPHPHPDFELYKSILQTGFKEYPQRLENYRKYQYNKRNVNIDYLPIKMDIENVCRCNYHCIMCQVSDWKDSKRADDMIFTDFKTLIDNQYGLIEIKLQGMGEPFLGKSYFDMIKYARSKHIWVRSSTNASLLHVNENYKKVIDAGICELQVSIDGTSKSSYEKIRCGGHFERIVKNCQLLNKYCNDTHCNSTRMWTMLQKDNFEELKMFPSFASELGFDRLTISLDLSDFKQTKRREINNEIGINNRFDSVLVNELIELGREANVEVTFWVIDKKYDNTDVQNLCPWPFERVYITSDMRIVPCCMIANPMICDLGNAHELIIEWNNHKMKVFREAHLKGNIPKICKSCYKKEIQDE